MLKFVRAAMIAVAIAVAVPVAAQVIPYPSGFRVEDIVANGTALHVRVGGNGPAVLLIHGYGESGDMWAPLAIDLARDHTVIVPDLRGMGLSGRANSGFDKKNEAADMTALLNQLGIGSADVVAHDIGNMVAYALAMEHPERVTRLAVIDAPIPGIGPWDEILKSPMLWHFRFGGPDMERLVAGRERIYLDRFWNEFSANPTSFDEASRKHYAALYARPGAMHAGFLQFAAFDQDAIDNKAMLAERGKLAMPVLALGGEKSFGPMMATVMRATAEHVEEGIVPASGHWIMEENPTATIALVRRFLEQTKVASAARDDREGKSRLTPDDLAALPNSLPGAGTSGIQTMRMAVLAGNPEESGPYTIMLQVPPETRIAAHTHKDERSAVVVRGVWYFGYGDEAGEQGLERLEAGSFYTEPAGTAHFARTGPEGATVYITGWGPSDTVYVQ